MPDIFVPEDTTGLTSYYMEAVNKGLINSFAQQMAEAYRPMMRAKTVDEMLRIIPRDNTLLNNFATYAAGKGLPARWYYINQSRSVLLNQIKAVIARDLVGYEGLIQILNQQDKTLDKALEMLEGNKSPVSITR